MVSARRFLSFQFVIAFLLFALGLYYFAPSADAITELVKFFTIGFIKGFATRGAVAVVYIILQSVLTFEFALNTPLWKRDSRPSLFEQFKAVRNNSHGFIFTGIILSGLAIATVDASTPDKFMFVVLTQGTFGDIIGNFLTMVIAFLGKIRSMDQFRDYVDEKDNDTWVIVVVAIKFAILALSLKVGH